MFFQQEKQASWCPDKVFLHFTAERAYSFLETLGGAKAPRVSDFSAEKYACSKKE